VLLELIEKCDATVKRLALSCMSTILENNKSFQFFVEWNSKVSGQNATQLLISIFKEEDKRFGVNIDNGVLQDIFRPLLPKTSYLARQYNGDGSAVQGSQIDDNTARDSMISMSAAPTFDLGMSGMRSKVASRLKTAVQQAKAAKNSKKNESFITEMLAKSVKTFDLRQVIFGGFYRVGFDLHELSYEEK